VEIVVPTAPGGSLDGTARLMQRILQNNRFVEVPVVVLNKAGGGGSIALSYLDQHAGDGHYLLISTMSLMTNHIQGRSKVNYTDYKPLATLFSEYMTLVVRPDSPLATGRDIQERLKRDPQSLSIAVGLALGASNHLTVALLAKTMGVDVKKLKTVVFQANADAQTALMGGHVDLSSLSAAAALRAAQQGRLRIIGVTSDKRGEGALADIPTWKEQGFDVVFTNTRLLLGPKGMSPAQTAYWDAALERVVQSEEWISEVQKNHAVLDYLGSKQSPQRMASIYNQLKGALVDAGLAK
jgi:putative tricarboxylic transport membrane protein